MGRYWYRRPESEHRESLEAASLPAALLHLQDQGLTVAEAGPELPPTWGTGLAPRLWALATVYENLATILEEGIALPHALLGLATKSADRRVRCALQGLAEGVTAGYSLSTAMSAQPEVFDELAVGAIAAAERAHNLPAGLRSLAAEQRREKGLATHLAVPLTYISFLLVVILAEMSLVVTFIAPKYFQLYRDLGMRSDMFPLPTLLLLYLTRVAPWMLVCLLLPLAFLWVISSVRYSLSRGRLEARFFGHTVSLLGFAGAYAELARLFGSLALLLRQRVQLTEALGLAAGVTANRRLALAVARSRHAVAHGQGLAESLGATGQFPPDCVFQLHAAEAGGGLVTELEHLADEYAQRSTNEVRSSVLFAGPGLVIVLGAVVGFVGYALFAPLMSIIGQLSGG